MFEIDVDVGRFVALFGNKSLDQRLHARRVDLGYAQTKTHGGICGRAPALAKNAFRARKTHDVVNRQEIRFVTELRDELQLVLDELHDLLRHTAGPALAHTLTGQLSQVACRGLAPGNGFVGILVAQLVERKVDVLRDMQRLAQQVLRIEMREHLESAEVTFTVRIQPETGLVDGHALADRRQRILQHAPGTAMHVHVAARYQR